MCLMNNELCCFLSSSVSDVSEWGFDMAENLLVEMVSLHRGCLKCNGVPQKKSIKSETAYIDDWTLNPLLKMYELISYIC